MKQFRHVRTRRDGHWEGVLAQELRRCNSSASYWRYENTTARFRQRLFYPRYGAGAHRLSREEFHAVAQAVMARRIAELDAAFGADGVGRPIFRAALGENGATR